LLKVLINHNGSSPIKTQTYRVAKEEELGKLLDTAKIREQGCIQRVEVSVRRDDAPTPLQRALQKHLHEAKLMMGLVGG
jgi:pyruvate decarboxylase